MTPRWNWQQSDWPLFTYDSARFIEKEEQFYYEAGFLSGLYKHIHPTEKESLYIDALRDEAIKSSEIEGEILNRHSVRSSICAQLGLPVDVRPIPLPEQGMARVMVDVYQHYEGPLSHESLYEWHRQLMQGRGDLAVIGAYRTHAEPMQIVSGYEHKPTVHFEAPPSSTVHTEMDRFITWFNDSGKKGKMPLSPIIRAGIAHLYFVSIHPFEDGNGRIARAIVEKSLSQSLERPSMIVLSGVIAGHRKAYYQALEQSNQSNHIDSWLGYFTSVILEAQHSAIQLVEFVIQKTVFYDRFRDAFNHRQSKAIARLFREGTEGFKGGLSADKYIRITGASRATATRDLNDLVEKSALYKTGMGKGTRYYMATPQT